MLALRWESEVSVKRRWDCVGHCLMGFLISIVHTFWLYTYTKRLLSNLFNLKRSLRIVAVVAVYNVFIYIIKLQYYQLVRFLCERGNFFIKIKKSEDEKACVSHLALHCVGLYLGVDKASRVGAQANNCL